MGTNGRIPVAFIVLLLCIVCHPVLAGSHFFTDGSIPDGTEVTVGVFDHDGDWDQELTSFPIRVETGINDFGSLFAQLDIIKVDTVWGNTTTAGIGLGGMARIWDDSPELPVDIALRGSAAYIFEKKEDHRIIADAYTDLECSVIASKNLAEYIDFDLTPYSGINLTFAIADEDNTTNLTLAMGTRARFTDQISAFLELDLGDRMGWGVGTAVRF